MMNDKSRASTAKQLSCDKLLHCKFINQFAGERTLKVGEHLAKLQAKWLIVLYAPFTLDFCPQKCRTRWISKILNLCMTDRNCYWLLLR